MGEALPLLKEATNKTLGYKNFESRKTPELVIAFVEPIGGGSEKAIKCLEDILKKEPFNYEINPISLSTLLKEESTRLSLKKPILNKELSLIVQGVSGEAERINDLQQYGNELRRIKGCDYLAKKAIQKIAQYRVVHDGIEQAQNAAPVPKALRVAHIIKSLKHKEELNLLKAVYGRILIIIAVSGDYKQQVINFNPFAESKNDKKRREKEYDILSSIDQDEGIEYGQQVRDIFYRADLFLNNDKTSIDNSIISFLGLLFSTKISCPTDDERMMFEAHSASLRSTCLSRQVGAAISDSSNELVSIGWNDIPCFGGGLATDHTYNDALCKSKGHCRSTVEINNLQEKIYKQLKDKKLLTKKAKKDDVRSALKSAGISGLIEFSRAIHAEMEAILSAARTSRIGLVGATIYVTTYPCENCVKHILTSGIKRVVYIEPYPKSRAKAFFQILLLMIMRTKERIKRTNLPFHNLRAFLLRRTPCFSSKNLKEKTRRGILPILSNLSCQQLILF